MSRSDGPLSKLYREFGSLALAATAYREVTTAQDNANEASSRGGNSRADMFETRDFYLACDFRCAGYELRPPRVRPMLVAWRQLREQIVVFEKAIRVLVKSNSACRLLMSVPGIGVLSALAYVSTVENPARFVRSRSVGAHLGLTPRQYQSGEVDRSGRISKGGDTLARTLLYESAVVILTRLKKASSLKDWGHSIARRSGNGKARVAVARKLSVILHSVWRSGQPFLWSDHANAA